MVFALDATAADELVEHIPFDRLSLPAAERLLHQYSRELRASQRAVDAAKAGILIAGVRPNPNVTLQTSNINPQAGISSGGLRDNAFDTQIRTDYLVERGEKRALRLASAADLERAKRILMKRFGRSARCDASDCILPSVACPGAHPNRARDS